MTAQQFPQQAYQGQPAPQGFPQQAPQQFPQHPTMQQPGYPQQAPASFPTQGFPQHAPQQAQGYPQQAQGGMGWAPQQGYPQQGYPQQGQQMPAGPPPAQGSLDAFNSQPVTGRPAGISFKGIEPNGPGSTFMGTITQDVGDSDVAQDRDPNTQQLKFYRDGRPKFHMALTIQLSPGSYDERTFPNGMATLYVRDRMHSDLTAAMQAAGVKGAPKGGDGIAVTLIERRQGRGTIPANIYRVDYQPGAGWGNVHNTAPHAPEGYPQQQPDHETAQREAAQAQQQAMQAQQLAQAPAQQYQAPAPQGGQLPQGYAPNDGSQPVQQYQAPAPQQAPAQQAPVQQAIPALDQAQQELLARLQAGAQG